MQLTSAVIVGKKAELNLSHVDQHSGRFLDQILPLKLLATLKQLEALLHGNHIFQSCVSHDHIFHILQCRVKLKHSIAGL
jgi:hypothetical protein